MGANKQWATEQLTADYPNNWEYDDLNVGSVTTTTTVDFGDFDYYGFPGPNELCKKYPSLQQAWDHYQMVLEMCQAKENEK